MLLLKKDRVICALDTKNLDEATKLVEDLKEFVGMFKLGLEFYMTNGIVGLATISTRNVPIFLDLKFYDIPNTVSKAIETFKKFDNVKMITVHAGDEDMIKAAVEVSGHIEIVVVTLLTSIKVRNSTKIVLERTEQALNAGASGIICSSKEVAKVRHKFGHDFKIIVPGIRWGEIDKGDQKRTGTPRETIKAGADYLVVGRPITQSESPVSVAHSLLEQL